MAGGPHGRSDPEPREVSKEPNDWCESIAQRDWTDRTEPVLIDEPIESSDAKEPMLPTDAQEPTLPIESTEPVDAMDSSESCDHSDHPLEGMRIRSPYGRLCSLGERPQVAGPLGRWRHRTSNLREWVRGLLPSLFGPTQQATSGAST